MTSPSKSEAAVIGVFAGIPALLDQAPALIFRGRNLDCECLLGPLDHPFHTSICGGRIIDLTPAPVLMRSWRFAYRATSAAWTEYWKPVPRPGWHDLFALAKREELGHFPMSENPAQFRRYVAPVLKGILEKTASDNQGVYV